MLFLEGQLASAGQLADANWPVIRIREETPEAENILAVYLKFHHSAYTVLIPGIFWGESPESVKSPQKIKRRNNFIITTFRR